MALYICRWENGDFSVVQAESKEHAIEMMDDVANAEGLPLYEITDFMVHFRLYSGINNNAACMITESRLRRGDDEISLGPDSFGGIDLWIDHFRERL